MFTLPTFIEGYMQPVSNISPSKTPDRGRNKMFYTPFHLVQKTMPTPES